MIVVNLKLGTVMIGFATLILSIAVFILSIDRMQGSQSYLFTGDAVIPFIELLASLLIIVGAIRENIRLLLPWLVFTLLLGIFLCVLPLHAFVDLALGKLVNGVVCTFAMFGGAMLYLFTWMVVYGHFAELRKILNGEEDEED